MHCVVASDEEGMMAALEDIIRSLVEMTSSLSCVSGEHRSTDNRVRSETIE